MSESGDEKRKTTRRALRAVFAADITGFIGVMSENEAGAISALNDVRGIVTQQLQAYEGWIFGMPGGGMTALFESAVNAVRCALETQHQLDLRADQLKDMRLRIGIHLGEVLFEKDLPYGEALAIAAQLEDLADPGGILVSAAVMDAVSARMPATFEERGVPRLKNIPRRIVTFAVMPPPERTPADETRLGTSILDRTTQFDRETLRQIRDQQLAEQKADRTTPHSSDAIIVQQSARQTERVNGNTVAASRKTPTANVDPAGADIGSNGAVAKARPAPGATQRPDEASNKPARPEPPAPPPPSPPPPVKAVPAPEAEAKPDEAAGAAEFRPSEECVESLIAALAVHLGPFAKVLINRTIKKSSSAEELVSLLEQQIQVDEERSLFRVRALHICMTFADRQSDET
jgi:class 3 adenylate cyclase